MRTDFQYSTINSLAVRVLSVCFFRTIIDCEDCRRPISINPGSTEAGEHGLTRGTCFIARRFEVVAVTGLLSFWWCVLGAVEFRGGFVVVAFLRTHTAYCKYEAALPHLPFYY